MFILNLDETGCDVIYKESHYIIERVEGNFGIFHFEVIEVELPCYDRKHITCAYDFHTALMYIYKYLLNKE